MQSLGAQVEHAPETGRIGEGIVVERRVPGQAGQQSQERCRDQVSREPRPGSRTVVDRLTDVLFVHILRRWTADQGEHGTSWVLGLRAPQVAAAISLLHEDPARPWIVEELAHRVGVCWRLELAGRCLRDTADTLPAMAGREHPSGRHPGPTSRPCVWRARVWLSTRS
ncbi:cupin domain-containing protein [Streptomyces sp. NPDC005890]|uniref:cupin domain-containing protein n=1 Tax=Streptomyces sp. NPDC005890 TaxID=3154568 RepID=UPI0033D8F6EE